MNSGKESRQPNRLIHETSPYLLQHAYNPVDWHPWGEEALKKAKEQGKPILLSVGYSACHWCHVMERESFENEEIAAIMNEHFINIKVDREERPDLDQVYQTAAQLLTGQGGWPLTVFLTPDQRPFYAGTYFPPVDRYGRPGFVRVMQSLVRTYREDPERIERAAKQLTEAVRQVDARMLVGDPSIRPEEGAALVEKAAEWLAHHFDDEHGGFGSAPKFPNASALEFLLRVGAREAPGAARYREMVRFTLEQMAKGGIYDQLGGGFHRYSVDAAWRIPHFEKMLYDNAVLVPVYLQAWQLTADPLFERVVRETLRYVEREMSHPEGGFYSAQDADSEGEEGKFFVWSLDEFHRAVGPEDAELAAAHFGVTKEGNFEGGRTVLHVARSEEELAAAFGGSAGEIAARLDAAKRRLFAARELRVKPGLDDKAVAAWNGMMITAFARAYEVLRAPAYLERARSAARFVEEYLVSGGRLLRSFKGRPSSQQGFLEDYAFWVAALIDLYEATLERPYLQKAHEWMQLALELFWDEESPGFFLVPRDHEALIHRPKDWRDSATPSGAGVCVQSMLRLNPAFEGAGYEEKARAVLELHRRQMDHNPFGTSSLLLAYDALVQGGTEVIVVARDDQSSEARELLRVVGGRYLPHRIVHLVTPEEAASPDAPSLWKGKSQVEGKVTAYVCRGFACSPPVTDAEALGRLL